MNLSKFSLAISYGYLVLWDLDHVGSSPYNKCYRLSNVLGKFSINVLRNHIFTSFPALFGHFTYDKSLRIFWALAQQFSVKLFLTSQDRANSYSCTKTNTSCCTVHMSGLALMTFICDYTELKYFPLNDWIIQGNPLFIFVSSEIYIALCTWQALNKHIWII